MRSASVAACILLVAGCDGSAARLGADGGPPDAPAGTGDFIDRLARAACVAISRCGEADLVELRAFTGTPEQCPRRMAARLAVGYRTEIALSAGGRVQLDQPRFERCLETIRTTCTGVAVLVAGGVCSRLFAGVVTDGGGCSDTLECAAGLWCPVNPTASDGCGRCRPTRPLGAACAVDVECSRTEAPMGVVCPAAGGFRCTRLQIGPEAAAGEPCGTINSATAVAITACAPALWCDLDDNSTTGVCRPPVPAGAACQSGRSVCQDGHSCPDDGATCQSQVIADRPGQPCNPPAGTPICNHYEGLTCDSGTSSCRLLARTDQSCDEDGDCDFGLFCDRQARRCQAPRADGGACQNDTDCIHERCASGICLARVCA